MNGVSGYSQANWERYQQQEEPAALKYCKNSEASVVKGVLCSEPTITSDACRSPKNDVDKTVCDDKTMHEAQRSAWDLAKWAIGVLIGKAK